MNPETKTDLTSLLYKVMESEGESQRYYPTDKGKEALKISLDKGNLILHSPFIDSFMFPPRILK